MAAVGQRLWSDELLPRVEDLPMIAFLDSAGLWCGHSGLCESILRAEQDEEAGAA